MSGRVFIVMLRRPGKDDSRSDPFWEYGSFGCTGCHRNNLLHPKKCQIRDGDRIAFVQGGCHGSRLVFVTPGITRVDRNAFTSEAIVELKWDCSKKPFRYDRAPLILESSSPRKRVLFPKLVASVGGADRSTINGKFASRFRSRSRPLESELAVELVKGFKMAVKKAKASDFIGHYQDALPWCDCPTPTKERWRKYQQFLGKRTASKRRSRRTGCHR